MMRLILRLFIDGRLPSFLGKLVYERAFTDPEWASAYHELRTAERALENAPLSGSQLAFVRARVLAEASAQQASREREAAAPFRGPWLAAAAAFACVALFVIVRGPDSSELGDLAPRGPTPGERGGVRVACLNAARSQVVSEADVGGAARELRCASTGLLAFSATNLGSATRWPAVVARHADGTVAFTIPFEDEAPQGVAAGSVAQALQRGEPLDEHAGQRLTLRATLLGEPASGAQLEVLVDDSAPSLVVIVE